MGRPAPIRCRISSSRKSERGRVQGYGTRLSSCDCTFHLISYIRIAPYYSLLLHSILFVSFVSSGLTALFLAGTCVATARLRSALTWCSIAPSMCHDTCPSISRTDSSLIVMTSVDPLPAPMCPKWRHLNAIPVPAIFSLKRVLFPGIINKIINSCRRRRVLHRLPRVRVNAAQRVVSHPAKTSRYLMFSSVASSVE